MRYVHRQLESQLKRAARAFPAVVVTGPRRAGKTWLLTHCFPDASHCLFEDPDVVARFRHDPQGFLDAVELPAILDEIQNAPEVFNYVRTRIDRAPRRAGQWLLTGSQEAGLMRNVTESMAGRAAVLQLRTSRSTGCAPPVCADDAVAAAASSIPAAMRSLAITLSRALRARCRRGVPRLP